MNGQRQLAATLPASPLDIWERVCWLNLLAPGSEQPDGFGIFINQFDTWIGSAPRIRKRSGKSKGVLRVKEVCSMRKVTAKGHP